ncbi:MAG: hypothetical protein LBK41_06540 [Clostridiales bacterium]|jgi:hypothetical protein|nr:hypothetical protein [Clostridiales bacterium]
MPTYRNDSGLRRVISGNGDAATLVFDPGESKPASFYIPGGLGLTLISSEPPVASPVLAAKTLTDETFDIPYSGRIVVSVIGVSGATAYFADDTEGVAVPDGGAYVLSGAWYEIGKVRVEGTADIVVERMC